MRRGWARGGAGGALLGERAQRGVGRVQLREVVQQFSEVGSHGAVAFVEVRLGRRLLRLGSRRIERHLSRRTKRGVLGGQVRPELHAEERRAAQGGAPRPPCRLVAVHPGVRRALPGARLARAWRAARFRCLAIVAPLGAGRLVRHPLEQLARLDCPPDDLA